MRLGKTTWQFNQPVYLQAAGTAVGPVEGEGPLGANFDKVFDSLYCDKENWELAERALMEEAVRISLEKVNMKPEDIDVMLAGDLLNQIVTSNYSARQLNIPFLGMFSACATVMEAVAVAAVLINSHYVSNALVAVSSHHSTAERQFRYPTEFGGQKPETANYTVTGSGAAVLSNQPSPIRVRQATIGQVVDMGVSNPLDMGSAMAPAAAKTLINHFKDTKRDPSYYDLIVTGDLSRVGSSILRKLVDDEGYTLGNNYEDCGVMIYHQEQPVFAGGSGAGCPAVVTFGYLMKEMERGIIKRLLVVATGALLSPLMIQQKETIPCIAHAVSFELEEDS
ncbi:stage V sporulation protein AD [Alkalihalophilus marmarensis]|uniref:stage V sporulation protein AD n=1 Tax=Alkalihalophilus marmarensis TaxID=521377 RepID=UPI002E244B01|nr:stage V sporulation protein AD [Alkalihalophilus marmarensis]MED1601393.1 stage V sporulation protein AD [Alkalihalophilus marmarensis]